MTGVAGRRQRFWDLLDLGSGRGLEIGPLHRPTVTPAEGGVSYVDVFATARLREMYANDPSVSVELIPEVDFTLTTPTGVQSLSAATAPGAPYDWVIASHVIEHVPDLVAWLAEVAEVTVEHGALVLAVPDRRYCFDLHRPPTTVGQILQAHELRETRPSVRAIFDHHRSILKVNTRALWDGKPPPGYDARRLDLAAVTAKVARGRAGEYVDSHVWTFTPASFLEQMAELRRLGLSSWYCNQIDPTRRGELEFLVVLRRLPPSADPVAAMPGEIVGDADQPDWLTEQTQARQRARELERRVRRLERRVARLRGQERDRARQIEGMRASWHWRLGGVALAPVRAARRLRRLRG